MAQLKGQVNALEAELEEQRKQKQKALVDNEQLRHEVARLCAAQLEGERDRGLREEAESARAGRGGAGWRVHGLGGEGVGGAGRRGPPLGGLGVTAAASPSPAEKASATEARYNKLKEKHSELINTHAELLRKVGPGGADGGRWDVGGPERSPAEPVPGPRRCRTQTRPSS